MNHKLIDQFNRNNNAGEIMLGSDSIRSHAATLILVLKNKSFKLAVKSYNGDGEVLLRKLAQLLMEMRNHKLALRMSHIQKDLNLTSGKNEETKPILSLSGDMYWLTRAFNNNQYCPVAFTELHDLVERYMIKIEHEINLGE